MSGRAPLRPGQARRPVGGGPNILRGILRLARGRAEGLAEFGDSNQAFLASLAPLVAFPLVGTGLILSDGGGLDAISNLLATLCALLAPPVLSWWLARRWGRDARWGRFATAFNWCQWGIAAIAAVLLMVLGVLMAAGLPRDAAGGLFVVLLIAYGLWLHWFIARSGLQLSPWRAVLLVLAVNFGTATLVTAPSLIASMTGP